MNKTAIKNFSVWARNELIAEITYKAGLLGITETGIGTALPQSGSGTEYYDIGTREPYAISGIEIRQRRELVKAIRELEETSDYQTAYTTIIDETAYTWFNRLIAIRFMEVNDYLPSRLRVLSSLNEKIEPDIVTTPFEALLEYTDEEKARIMAFKNDDKADELFRLLFLKQCNALNEVLPVLFEKVSDYTELLLTISYTDKEGVVYHLVHDIPEEDFNVEIGGQVEIIGWLYQYYNTEPKAKVFARASGTKIKKEEIPAATQLFTPDWIVRYMVENSLGRMWIEGHPNDELKAGWKYYLDEAEQESEVEEQLVKIREEYSALQPEEIRCVDVCSGSGHILCYFFDILMQIYLSQGYSQRDAARSILKNNIYGLDIDDRAYQLSYFAVMMKARQYDKRIFSQGIQPHVYSIVESNGINRDHLKYFGSRLDEMQKNNAMNQIEGLVDVLHDAKEYGSLLTVENYDWNLLREFTEDYEFSGQMNFDTIGIEKTQELLKKLIDVGEALAQKYHVCVTNPPYMSVSNADAKVQDFVKKNYPDSKADLFATFIERCGLMTMENGYQAMITQHSWMFLSSFENLRTKLLQKDTINMAHLGARAFEEIGGEVVQTTSFVMRKSHVENYKGTYCRLIDPNTQQGKEDMFLNGENRYFAQQNNFSKIPGAPVAYWLNSKIYNMYTNNYTMQTFANPKVGMQTSNNERFLRLWYEVNWREFNGSSLGLKWIKYLKGGAYRKWYGNLDYVLLYNYSPDYILQQKNARVLDESFLKKKKCTWTDITSGKNSFRIAPEDTFYDISGHCFFPSEEDQYWLLGYSNTVIFSELLKVFNSTFHCQVSDVGKVVVPNLNTNQKRDVNYLARECVKLSKQDWDSFETSWNFKRHPLVITKFQYSKCDVKTLHQAYIETGDYDCKNQIILFLQHPDDIHASAYIKNYFYGRSKSVVFSAISKDDLNKRSVHMVSAFLMGRYIEQRMDNIFPNIIKGSDDWDFEYLWFLTCLYHDVYFNLEGDQIGNVNSVIDLIKIDVGTNEIKTIYDKEICGIKLPEPTYDAEDVEKYFQYRISASHHQGYDHGIRGGYNAFHRLTCNYLDARENNGGKDEFLTNGQDGKTLCWDVRQIDAYARVADAIIVHNIFHASDEVTIREYKVAGLGHFLKGSNCISFEKNPLAYLLCLVDTIEPIKYFTSKGKNEVEVFNTVTIDIQSSKIVLGQVQNGQFDLRSWYKDKISNMSDWLEGIYMEYDDENDKIVIVFIAKLSNKYAAWEAESNNRFNILKFNEEKLNRIFIDIYDLRDELTSEEDDKDVSVRKADLQRDIKSLISYAVGCMFGRYSLYNDGLFYAGGEWDYGTQVERLSYAARESGLESWVSSSLFLPDEDNIIPITDEEYFEDDIAGLFCIWLKAVYGPDTLEENLDFIAKALGNKGSNSREVIRNYFVNDFFKDHCSTYSVTGSGKRPIYWLYDSGKQNGFKALVYMHRYDADTTGKVRVNYLHRMEKIYDGEMNRMDDTIASRHDSREITRATKRKEKLQRQLKECREYDEKIAPLALSRIDIDLDDGVKVNYRKVQTDNKGKFHEILADSRMIMAKEK